MIEDNINRIIQDLNQLEKSSLSSFELIDTLFSALNNCCLELVKNDIQTFNTLIGRLYFVSDQYQLANEDLINLIHLINLHKEYPKNKQISLSEHKINSFLLSLRHLLMKAGFSDLNFITESENFTLSAEHVKSDIEFISKMEFWISDLTTSLTKYQTTLLKLDGYDDKGRFLTVYLWDEYSDNQSLNYGKKFSLLIEMYFKNCHILLYNIKYSNNKSAYVQTKDTFFIFYPDIMIDATTVSECFSKDTISPEVYFLKLFRNNEFSEAIFKGNIINALLDNTLSCKHTDIDNMILSFIENNVLKILSIDEINYDKIKKEISDLHLPNILKLKKQLLNTQITIEPSFISYDYGLQGRLDGLIENNDKKTEKNIFELKSGKAPLENVWRNHQAQIACYDLILSSVWGFERTGYSMIFYSVSQSNPLRNVPNFYSLKYQVIMVRNQITNYILKLANGDFTDFLDFINNPSEKLPAYLLPQIHLISYCLKNIVPYEKEYIFSYISFLFKEMLLQKIGYVDPDELNTFGFSALWNLSLEEKSRKGQILDNLSLQKINENNITFIPDINSFSLNFRENDPIILYGKSNIASPPLHSVLFKGTITNINQDQISVLLKNDTFYQYSNKFESFVIEHDFLEFNFYSALQSLFEFISAPKRKRDLIFGLSEPQYKQSGLSFSDEAIQKAFEAQDYCIIQGPPGTGKTSKIIIGLVKKLLSETEDPISILAFTNRATEEIIEKLISNNLEFIKIGTKDSDKPYHIKSFLKNISMNNYKSELNKSRIFVSTVSSFLNDGLALLKIVNEGILIIDEASQLLEPHLVGLLTKFKKFILVGDHYQLPAVSVQKSVPATRMLNEKIQLTSLNGSLFERLFNICKLRGWDHAWHTLKEHYRMHERIADLINPYYDNQLKCALDKQFGQLSYMKDNELFKKRLYYINAPKSTDIKLNHLEANAVCNLVNNILCRNSSLSTLSIGVITLWKAQSNLIKHKLVERNLSQDILVDTVERFQGLEKDIIILSTALNHFSQLNIISSLTHDSKVDRKLNVAISRAKELFFLIGDIDILKKSSHYNNIIDKMTLWHTT